MIKILKNFIVILFFIYIFSYSTQEPKADETGAVIAGAAITAAVAYSATQNITTPSIGGTVTYIAPCAEPPAINFVTVQPKPPFIGTGAWMFMPGSFPFLYGPPVHPAQQVLGKALPVFVPCINSAGGLLVMYTGTSE